MCIVVFVFIFWAISSSYCCSKKPEIERFKVFEIADCSYSIPTRSSVSNLTRDVTNNFIHFYNSTKTSYSTNYEECKRIRKGLKQLTYGYHKFFFNDDESEIMPHTLPLFLFDCSDKKHDRGDLIIPNQVYHIKNHITTVNEDHHRIYSGLNQLVDFSNEEIGFWPASVSTFLKKMKYSDLKENISTSVFSYHKTIYAASLLPEIKLSKEAMDHYLSLPNTYTGNEIDYFLFFKNYGTHVFKNCVVGGRLYYMIRKIGELKINRNFGGKSLVDQELKQTIQELIYGVLTEFKGVIRSRFIVSLGGEYVLNTNVKEWSSSVNENPQIIAGDLLPLINMFEKNPESASRFTAFNLGLESEKLHHAFKKMVMQIRPMKDILQIANFIFLKVNYQKRLINPDIKVFNIINNIFVTNPTFNKDGIEVTLPDKQYGNNVIEKHLVYILVEGVCLTPKPEFKTSVDLQWIGAEIDYVVDYESINCLGTKTMFKSSRNMYKTLHLIKSFKLCEKDDIKIKK